MAVLNLVTYADNKHSPVDITELLEQFTTDLPFTKDLAYDSENQTLTWSQEGDDRELDLKEYLVDIHTKAVRLDGATLVITETDGKEYTVDLAEMSKSKTNNSTTVALTGDGSGTSPLKATAVISAAKGNLLTAESDGLAAKFKTPVVESITASGSKLTVKSVATDGTESSQELQLAGSASVATKAAKLKTTTGSDLPTEGYGDRSKAVFAGALKTITLPDATDPSKSVTLVVMDYAAYIDATE